MNTDPKLDAIRASVLRSAERTDLYFRLVLLLAALAEAGGLAGLLLLVDFKDRLHQLILLQTLLAYGSIALGLLAVGILVRTGTVRILKAVELSTSGSAHAD